MNDNFIEKVLRDTWPLVTKDCYLKFIVLWTLFEVWIKENSDKDRIRIALDWFKSNANPLKEIYKSFWNTDRCRAARNTFNTIGHKYGFSLSDKKDPNEIIEAIYEVRNNLVHGDWQLVDYPSQESDDYQNLICGSATILRDWLEAGKNDKIL